MKKSILIICLLIGFVSSAQTLKQGSLSNVTKLTKGDVQYENPQWSKDGQKIAFTKLGYDCLFVMDATGRNVKQISSDSGVGIGFQWSVDNNEILVRDTRWNNEGRLHAIWAVGMNGEKVKISKDAFYMQPAAWRYTARGEKKVMMEDGALLKSNLKSASSARIKGIAKTDKSLNKSLVADGEAIYVIDEFGAKTKVFDGCALCPVFSPDGSKIAYALVDGVYIMNADGSAKKKLGEGFRPTWVNNSQVVYEYTVDNGHEYESGDLYMTNIHNGKTVQITNTKDMIEMYPAVSPDGNKILFVSEKEGQIYSATLK